jgi:hypothetical protein
VVALINRRIKMGNIPWASLCVCPLFDLGRGDPHIQILKMCFLDYIPDYLLNKMEKRNFSLLFDAKDERLVLQIRECYFCEWPSITSLAVNP